MGIPFNRIKKEFFLKNVYSFKRDDRQTDRQYNRNSLINFFKRDDGQTDKQTDRQTDRRTDRQTNRQTNYFGQLRMKYRPLLASGNELSTEKRWQILHVLREKF